VDAVRLLPLADARLGRLPPAVSLPSSKRALRLALLFTAALLAVGLSGCGLANRKTLTDVSQNELSAGAEPYFDVGAITYQVQESRQLNPFLADDAQYFTGVPGAQNLTPSQLWFGVFLWAKNQTTHTQTTADRFELVDSAGTVYQQTQVSQSNPFGWTSMQLLQNGTEPGLDSIAAAGPTGGSLVLFKVDQSIYSNRPLTMEIFAPGATKPSTVSLDL